MSGISLVHGFPVHREEGVDIVIVGVHGTKFTRPEKKVRDRISSLKISKDIILVGGLHRTASKRLASLLDEDGLLDATPLEVKAYEDNILHPSREVRKKFLEQLGFKSLRNLLQGTVQAPAIHFLLHPKAREKMRSVADYSKELRNAIKKIEEFTTRNSAVFQASMMLMGAREEWLSKEEEKNYRSFIRNQFDTFRSLILAEGVMAALPKAAQERKRIILFCNPWLAHGVLAFLQDKRLSEEYRKWLVPPLSRIRRDAAGKLSLLYRT